MSSKLDSFLGLTSRSLTPSYVNLPQYLLDDYGSELEGFNDVTEWTVDAGSAADNATAGEFRTGVHSIKITSGAGTAAQITKTFAVPQTFASGQHMRVYFFVHDVDTLKSVTITLVAADNKTLGHALDSENNNPPMRNGWNAADIYPDQFTGTATWATTFTKLRVIVTPLAAVVAEVSVDQLRTGLIGTAAIIFSFDDASLSMYNLAYAYLNKYYGRGTFYIKTSQVTVGSDILPGHLREMQADGWSIANHTRSHVYGLGYADELADIQNGYNDLVGWGLTNAANHFSYPGCGYNDDIIQAAVDGGMLTGRACTAGYPILDSHFDQQYVTPLTHAAAEAQPIETWYGWIDDAVTYKRPLVVFCHSIGPGLEFETAFFRSLVDYAYSKGLPFLTIEDLYDSLSGPISVPIL